jgi:hypothetical protein
MRARHTVFPEKKELNDSVFALNGDRITRFSIISG